LGGNWGGEGAGALEGQRKAGEAEKSEGEAHVGVRVPAEHTQGQVSTRWEELLTRSIPVSDAALLRCAEPQGLLTPSYLNGSLPIEHVVRVLPLLLDVYGLSPSTM
jgi:hypothetical protein